MKALYFVLILGFCGQAYARSEAEWDSLRDSICATPENSESKSAKTPSASDVEAKADCLECQKKIPFSKVAADLQESSGKIEDSIRKKRDLEYLRFSGLTPIKEPLENLREKESSYRNGVLSFQYGSLVGGEEEIQKSFQAAYYQFTISTAENKTENRSKLQTAALEYSQLISKKLAAIETSSEKLTQLDDRFEGFVKDAKNLEASFAKLKNVDQLSDEELKKVLQPARESRIRTTNANTLKSTIMTWEKVREELKKAEADKSPDMTEDEELAFLEGKALEAAKKSGMKAGYCGMSPAEIYALYDYTYVGFRNLNAFLRETSKPGETTIRQRDIVNSALSKLKKYDGETMRGANEMPTEVLDEHKVGAIVKYPAFTSTSVTGVVGGMQSFVIKSKNGRYIAPLSASRDEEEVLFQAGAKFKILSVEMKVPIKPDDSPATIENKKKALNIVMEEVE